MWFFVDESWCPNDYRPQFGVLLGVLVKDEDVERFGDLLYAARKKYYSSEHAKDLSKELKGMKLMSSYTLKRHKARTPTNNINIVKEILSYPEKYGTFLRVFASTVFRVDGQRPTLLCPDPKRLAWPFKELVQNVSLAAKEVDPSRTVTLVFDQRLGAQKDLAIAVRNFIKGIAVDNVHPTPYFAVSNASPCVQIADVFAALLSKRAQKKGYWINQLYNDLMDLRWISRGRGRNKRYGLNRYTETGEHPNFSYSRRDRW